MNEYGKVIEYDGYVGKIIDENMKEYLLLKKEIIEGIQVEKGDIVSFNSEEFDLEFTKKNIARFVKVLKKESEQ